MRFLCLHGAGTNAEIFDLQLGGIISKLAGEGHSFSFINGRIPSKPYEEFGAIFDGPFYNHYSRTHGVPGETLSQAFEHTLQAVREKGPFDGVIGFSQGAALACSLLVHMKKRGMPLFKCAVFICTGPPFEESGLELLRAPSETDRLVDIPTAHILGKQDELFEQGMQLYRLCDPEKAVLYDHGLGHKIPFDSEITDRMVAAIEEVIGKAHV